VAETLGIGIDKYGFFVAPDEMMPTDTTRNGVYMAGYCQKPMDIPDAVAQGSAAAARAMEAMAQHPKGGKRTKEVVT
jgi:heterodisulfide reductase subunit A